ncbi:MAG TPA: elongation factor G [Phycisphaerales bacterium]|nr:elongation factor G [Phycisphaerales bacterium]HMP36673.1 elongation factor G [Phycisphaerales bacterium]
MPKYTTEDIRNIAVVGGPGTGKTTLVEAMLAAAGAIGRAGRVEDGTTLCDYDDIEKEMKHSLDSALVHFDYGGAHINLIDTPGSSDFLGKAIGAFPAVETVMVVIDAAAGVHQVTQRLMKIAQERNLPRMIVVNRIDAAEDLAQVVADIKEAFGNICLPVNLPADGGKRVVDCFRNTAGESDLGAVDDFHTAIHEQIIEVDEELMQRYLEQGKVAHADLHAPFEKALREAHLVPICFTAARDGIGVKELLDVIVGLCPNPTEGNPRPFEYDRDGTTHALAPIADRTKPLLAHVFKVSADPYVGKLAVFKVHQGSLGHNVQPKLDDGRKPIRVSHVFKLQGKAHAEVDEIIAGDIGACAKIDEIHTDSVLHDGTIGEHIHLRPLPLPRPMYGLAIEGANKNAENKLGEALAKMAGEDPTFEIDRVAATHQLVIRGLGELHLRVKLRLLKDRYGVEVRTEQPKVAYKETITAKADGHHRHKKQTGGAGQFGEVFLRIEPLPADHAEGFEFVDDTFGGSVPRQFMPAIEKGIRGVLASGCVAGYPMQGVRVAVYDGKHHPVDSKEVAFITAGKRAFIDAVSKARPALLEPFVKLDITIPADMIGDIAGDLSSKRGRIQGTEMLPGNQAVVKAEAPLSEVMTYASTLKSMTGGVGSYTMEYSHDEQAPPNIQASVVAAYKPHSDDDE